MSNLLEYKNYHTRVEYDAESHLLHGKIEGIRDFVNFESSSIEDLEEEFHSAVDDYLDFCAEVGKEPDKEYKGSFNVRISPSLHRELALEANKANISLNQAVEKAIHQYLHPVQFSNTAIIVAPQNNSKMYSQPNIVDSFAGLNWAQPLFQSVSRRG